MAFTVETGAGVAGANSYVDTVDADTYLGDRGYTAWAGYTTAQKQARLINATQYVDKKYYWQGLKTAATNPLNWPRAGAYDVDGNEIGDATIPQALKDAVCLAALEDALVTTLARGGGVQSETVGPVSVSYFSGAVGGNTYPQITLALQPIIGATSSQRKTDR